MESRLGQVPTVDQDQTPRKLASWIDSFVEWTAAAPSPEIFRLWAGISAVAGALERRCWVTTGAGPIYPNLFIILIGPPATGKDQAIAPMRDLWAAAGKFNIAPISMTHKGMIDQLADESSHKNVMNNDAQNPEDKWMSYHSLLIASPELGVLLPANDLPFMSCLNELYNCWDLFEERIRMKGEVLRIEKPHIHIIAGTQPKYLGEIFPESAYGLGFTSRLIMVYSGAVVKVELFKPRPYFKSLRANLIEDLRSIELLRGSFQLETEAKVAVEAWHAVGSEQDKPTHSKLQHYNGRRIMHVLKITMALNAARTSSMMISLKDFETAKSILLDAEAVMPEIFKEMSSGGSAHEIEEAFHFIVQIWNKTKKPIAEHRLVNFLSHRVPVNQIGFLIDTMLAGNIIKIGKHPTGLNITSGDRYLEPLSLNATE